MFLKRGEFDFRVQSWLPIMVRVNKHTEVYSDLSSLVFVYSFFLYAQITLKDFLQLSLTQQKKWFPINTIPDKPTHLIPSLS